MSASYDLYNECEDLRAKVQEQATEIESLNSQLVFEMEAYSKVHKELTRQRDNLLAQVDEAVQDAERYRWLREQHNDGCVQWFVYGAWASSLDEAIDAAIKGSET